MNPSSHSVRSKLSSLLRWFDSEANHREEFISQQRSEWLRVIPFGLVHLTCFAVFWVGWSPVAIGLLSQRIACACLPLPDFITAISPIEPFPPRGLLSSYLP